MAKTYKQADFDVLMKKVEQIDIRVKEYLELAGYEKWARIYSTVDWGSTMTSNIAESINSALVEARELPIYGFFEEVRQMFGRWNFTNRSSVSFTFTPLCGKAQEILVENEAKSTRMTVVATSDYVHNVNDEGTRFIICLNTKICTCMRFQMEEISCSHAWAVLKSKHLDPDPFCSEYYKPNMVLSTYNNPIHPLPDRSEWKVPEHIKYDIVCPPKFKKPPGRPRKKVRDKAYSELHGKKSKNHCSTCGNEGHNRRSCRNGPCVT